MCGALPASSRDWGVEQAPVSVGLTPLAFCTPSSSSPSVLSQHCREAGGQTV